jgi:hypothetical protein
VVGGLTHRRESESTGTIAHTHTLSHTALTYIMYVHAESHLEGGALPRITHVTREYVCVCTNLFGLTYPLVYVLKCQAT